MSTHILIKISISYIVFKFNNMFGGSRRVYVITDWSRLWGLAGWYVCLHGTLDIVNDCSHSTQQPKNEEKTPDITATTFTAHINDIHLTEGTVLHVCFIIIFISYLYPVDVPNIRNSTFAKIKFIFSIYLYTLSVIVQVTYIYLFIL